MKVSEIEKEIVRIKTAINCIAQKAYGSADTLPTLIPEILNPPDPDKFMECDTCRAKPGSPMLCRGCLQNREIIYRYERKVKKI